MARFHLEACEVGLADLRQLKLDTRQPNGRAGLVLAHDPWTCAQVAIRHRKRVTIPSDFPLIDFRIDGYQAMMVQ